MRTRFCIHTHAMVHTIIMAVLLTDAGHICDWRWKNASNQEFFNGFYKLMIKIKWNTLHIHIGVIRVMTLN